MRYRSIVIGKKHSGEPQRVRINQLSNYLLLQLLKNRGTMEQGPAFVRPQPVRVCAYKDIKQLHVVARNRGFVQGRDF